jgi:hypothetical protein
MLGLHDAMKADMDYQRNVEQQTIPFPSGCTWICFADQTSHAAMSGQFMMEQTINLPVSGLYQPERSPLKILEKMRGRVLN